MKVRWISFSPASARICSPRMVCRAIATSILLALYKPLSVIRCISMSPVCFLRENHLDTNFLPTACWRRNVAISLCISVSLVANWTVFTPKLWSLNLSDTSFSRKANSTSRSKIRPPRDTINSQIDGLSYLPNESRCAYIVIHAARINSIKICFRILEIPLLFDIIYNALLYHLFIQ